MKTNAKRLVYFEWWIDDVGLDRLAKEDDIEVTKLLQADNPADNWAQLERAHGYQILPRGELDPEYLGSAELLAHCPDLLAISSTGAGYDMVDVAACTEAGVVVVNQTGTNQESVAQHVLAMMLALSKQLIQSDRALRRDRNWTRMQFTGRELTGKTLGIVGIGNIGTRVSEICRTLFDQTVIAYDPYLTPQQFAERGAASVSLDELFTRADFVSINCPRSDETFGMINAHLFGLMKPSAFFINAARGGIHDEAALAAALKEKRIAGAGIDVFLEEPPAMELPFLHEDNVVLSPHIAGLTEEAAYRMGLGSAEQWVGILRGERPPRLVNPEVWPKYVERFERVMGIRIKE